MCENVCCALTPLAALTPTPRHPQALGTHAKLRVAPKAVRGVNTHLIYPNTRYTSPRQSLLPLLHPGESLL